MSQKRPRGGSILSNTVGFDINNVMVKHAVCRTEYTKEQRSFKRLFFLVKIYENTGCIFYITICREQLFPEDHLMNKSLVHNSQWKPVSLRLQTAKLQSMPFLQSMRKE